nr:hypothetical protein [Tanacetum cinerariifolium]
MPPSTPPRHHLPLPPSTLLPGDAPPTTATTKGACGFVKAPRKTPPGCVWSDKQQRAAFGFVINPKKGAFGYRINQTGTFGLAVKQPGNTNEGAFGVVTQIRVVGFCFVFVSSRCV